MEYELARELKEAGFPSITRWEIENNDMRKISVTHVESLPPLGALLSEIENPAVWKGGISFLDGFKEGWLADTCLLASIEEKVYADTPSNREAGCAGEKFLYGYIDTHPTDNISFGVSPEVAVAKLYIAINKK